MDSSIATSLVIGLAACGLVLFAFAFRRKSSRSLTNKALLETIIGGKLQTELGAGTVPKAGKPSRQLALLEGHLRIAILDPGARERMVAQAMRSVGSDRAAAIRKVLADLEAENKRWS